MKKKSKKGMFRDYRGVFRVSLIYWWLYQTIWEWWQWHKGRVGRITVTEDSSPYRIKKIKYNKKSWYKSSKREQVLSLLRFARTHYEHIQEDKYKDEYLQPPDGCEILDKIINNYYC